MNDTRPGNTGDRLDALHAPQETGSDPSRLIASVGRRRRSRRVRQAAGGLAIGAAVGLLVWLPLPTGPTGPGAGIPIAEGPEADADPFGLLLAGLPSYEPPASAATVVVLRPLDRETALEWVESAYR